MFTLSRGPWIGLATGLLVWLVLLWRVAGRRMLLRGSLFLGAVFVLTTIAVVVIGPPEVWNGAWKVARSDFSKPNLWTLLLAVLPA